MLLPKSRTSPEPLFAAVCLPHFPAQSLAAANPALRGQPFAVIEQNSENHKTPILAVSDAARMLGIAPGTPVYVAGRRWPRLKFIPRNLSSEAQLRKSMETLLLQYTPVVVIRENGGALLDMAGTPSTRKMLPEVWARRLQTNLRGLGLEAVAIGVASSQIVARVLARLNTPQGVQVCPRGEETQLLDPLPPSLLPDLSPHGRALLQKYGLDSIATVRRLGKEELVLRFGEEGEKLYTLARGQDLERVSSVKKILTAETVLLQDLNNQDMLRNQVRLTADKLAHALRLQHCKAGKVTLALTHSDKHGVRKTARLHPPTASFTVLAEKAEGLFAEIYQRRVALRRIQLLASFPQAETGQVDLFDSMGTRKQEALEQAIDRIRKKRSFGAVLSGSNVASK